MIKRYRLSTYLQLPLPKKKNPTTLVQDFSAWMTEPKKFPCEAGTRKRQQKSEAQAKEKLWSPLPLRSPVVTMQKGGCRVSTPNPSVFCYLTP